MTPAAGIEIASAGLETVSGAGSQDEGSLPRSNLSWSGIRGGEATQSAGAGQGASGPENARSSWQSALASAGIFPADADAENSAETAAEGDAYKTASQALSGAPGPIAVLASSGAEAASPAGNLLQLSHHAPPAGSIPSTMVSLDAGSFAPGSIAVPGERSRSGSDAQKIAHALSEDHARKQAMAQSAGKQKTADEPAAAACLPTIAIAPLIQAPAPVSASSRTGSPAGGGMAGSVDHAAELIPLAAQSRSAEGAIPATANGDAAIWTGNEHVQSASHSGADVQLSGPTLSGFGSSGSATPAPAFSTTGAPQGTSSSQEMHIPQRVAPSASGGSSLASAQPAGQQAANVSPAPSGVEDQSAEVAKPETRGPAAGASKPTGSASGHTDQLRAAGTDAAQSVNQARVLGRDQPGLLPAREPSGMQPQLNAARGSGPEGESSSSTGQVGVHGTFASLDAAGISPATTWLHAGARSAEAGFQDQDLGWVRVRAQMDPSGVHAALVPGSPYAAQALGGHLAGLNFYLAEHHTPVQTLTMAAPEGHGNERDMEQGSRQGAGQGDNPGSRSDQDASQDAGTRGMAARSTVSVVSVTTVAGVLRRGATISVMA